MSANSLGREREAGKVVLIGPPGVGKSTIGPLLARQLGLSFSDTDYLIEASTGMPIPAIFKDLGEQRFRQIEADAVSQALNNADVISIGGGAVMTESTQTLLREFAAHGGLVVFLDVSAGAVTSRVGGGAGRPLLAGSDALANWQALYAARLSSYQTLATAYLDTTNCTLQQVVGRLVELLKMSAQAQLAIIHEQPAVIRVPVAQPYDVVIGRGVSNQIAAYLGTEVTKVLVIYPEPLAPLANPVINKLTATGYEVVTQVVPDAEAQKTWAVAASCWEAAGQAAITRSDAVVAIGGGATTDLGGFVAATWLRGVKVIQVPTSLLAMVDAAVGGKTGINTPQGKNLVGAFHQPAAVLCDLDMLKTLPARDFSAGLAEVIKCGFIRDPIILALVKEHATALTPWRGIATDGNAWAVVAELITRAIAVKAEVTADDPTEQGKREILNYGHTLGHAIEHHEGFTWRHGEAVSVGMVFAAELARLVGQLTEDEVALHRELLSAANLPVAYPGATLAELLPAMHRDKKARGARLRFITLAGIGNPDHLTDPPHQLLQQAFACISI